MYTHLFNSVVFPALDVLNRTSIRKVVRFLRTSEGFSRDRLRSIQEEKLHPLLAYAGEHSRFYREWWLRAPEDRRAGSDHPELDGVPIVSKQELRDSTESFPLAAFRGRSLRVRTSGSTGEPMTFVRSAEQESWFWGLRIRMWRWAGFELGSPYMAINLNRRDAWNKKLQDLFFRCAYLTYNADTINSRHIVERLRSSRIEHINAFGSTLYALARYMKEHGIRNPGVRVLTSTGDDLHEPQRRLIEEVFGVGVTDYYGAGGEGMHLASQCERREGYHIHMENSIVEIIRDGRPAKSGEVGSVVVTQLDNRAMPLIRYDLGDLARVGDGSPCACGRAHPVLDSIGGRACDLVYTPAGSVLLPQFFFIGAFKNLRHVARYQVVQEELDRVVVNLVAEEGCDRRACETDIARYLVEASDGSLKVEFAWVSEIPLSGLGKPRPILSKLTETPGLAESVSREN